MAGAYRIVTLGGYLHDPHLIKVSLAELVILVAAAALVASDSRSASDPSSGLTRASPPRVAARASASVDLVEQVKAITGIR